MFGDNHGLLFFFCTPSAALQVTHCYCMTRVSMFRDALEWGMHVID